MEKNYDPLKYEPAWTKKWLESKVFSARVDSDKTPYTIIIPPPNVTDRLHMGHGLVMTLQDILIRWRRMQGYNSCWVPGTDHAGISTQMMVEKDLERQGLKRTDMSREEFFAKCVEWKDTNGSTIIEQIKQLGSSCDWDREAYTMEPRLSEAVREIFVRLYEDGLIYRGERLVNWDSALGTAVSDDEVFNEEVQGNLYYIKYPVADSDQFLTIATTRPETMFGDTAIAVNGNDERYQQFIGKSAILPFSNRQIPIITDDYVKSEFGTGCLKVTPAHDPNDFALGKKHNLQFINIFTERGTLSDECPDQFVGLTIVQARKQTVIALKEQGLLVETKPIKHSVPFSERTKVVIEPRLSKQWYVKMDKLAELGLDSLTSGKIKFHPDSWKKTYYHWLENIQDWCISRQLWWGHQIPMWECSDCHQHTTGREDPTSCSHCGSKELTQDPDVLDTWFSSWLWPISPFGWPNDTQDLNYFFPTSTLVTGPDIIYLWVARMIMVSRYTRNEVPFKDVYFNAIICDKEGRKFSKTLGNGIDPLELITSNGADAVRYTIVSLSPAGGRVKLARSDFDSGTRFVNKLWNAGRFVLNLEVENTGDFEPSKLPAPMQWLVAEYLATVCQINDNLENFRINEAVSNLHHFVWGNFCDWGLELVKALQEQNSPDWIQIKSACLFVFEGALRLCSPVIPFVTEEISKRLPSHPRWQRSEFLSSSSFPKNDEMLAKATAASHQSWRAVNEVISTVRSVKTNAQLPKSFDRCVTVVTANPLLAGHLQDSSKVIATLCSCTGIEVAADAPTGQKCLVSSREGFTVYLPVEGLIDISSETERMTKEQARLTGLMRSIEKKLSSPAFVDRAPAEVVEDNRRKLAEFNQQLRSVTETLESWKI